MPTVVGVKLRFTPKTLWFDPAGTEPAEGDQVVVETERGAEMGVVTEESHDVARSAVHAPLKSITRTASEEDLRKADDFHAKEREAMTRFRELVESHGLDMKPIDVEYLFGGDKIVFYFSSEERVDFRELVRELANEFKVRIDMRQIGVRDEARLVGGLGHCGQQLCCARMSGDFQPVSIRMAKEQDLPLNPLKISGLCGRLMCCLRYEYDAYKDYKTRAPKRGAIIDTPSGFGKVTDLNTPKETVSVRLEDGSSFTVPLGSMSCSKDCGCPCSVSREALDDLGMTSIAMAAPQPLEAPESAPPPTERKPRRRAKSGKPEQAAQSASKDAATEKSGKPSKPAADAASKPEGAKPAGETVADAGQQPKPAGGRRRRRRRSGGGAPGNEGGGAS